MLNYWRLDATDGDFFLVEAPSLAIASKVRAYHLQLLSIVRSVGGYYQVVADGQLFDKCRIYYEKIAQLLEPSFNPSQLINISRHRFFVAAEERSLSLPEEKQTKIFWVSGLEILMGFDYRETPNQETKIIVTSGNYEVDVLAEILMASSTSQSFEWLINNRSPQYLIALVRQMSDRMRGEERIREIQRERDLAQLNTRGDVALEELERSGFKI